MKTIKKILVPIDFSEHSFAVFKEALLFAKKISAGIFVLSVVEDISPLCRLSIPHVSVDVFMEEMMAKAEDKLKYFLEEERDATIVCESKVEYGRIADQIIKTAVKEKIDLIFMGTRGYKSTEKMLLDSVAGEVVCSAPCSVLICRP